MENLRQHGIYHPQLADVAVADELLRSRDGALAKEQDAQAARLAEIDGRITKLEHELAEAQAEERTLWVAYEKKAFDKMKEANIDVEQVADKTPFQTAVKPVWEKYGPKYAELIQRIQAVQ